MTSPILDKVTAFVTRIHDARSELLVFTHPRAGLQLPAGTVEPAEDVEAAARREVREETGVEGLELVQVLPKSELILTGAARVVLHDVELRSAPSSDGAVVGQLRRGLTVDIEAQRDGLVLASYRERDLSADPARLVAQSEGWVPQAVLGARIVRHFFHYRFQGQSAAEWEHRADGHLFRPHWVALDPLPQLVRGQDLWLEMARPRLLTAP